MNETNHGSPLPSEPNSSNSLLHTNASGAFLTVSFIERIRKMNETFNLPSNDKPTDQGLKRLQQFYSVVSDELEELDAGYTTDGPDFTALADCLGDLVVYVFSEARRWGIPLIDVLHIIMDSQDSKLVDGKPLMAPDGSKFIKGPNYAPPEERIKALLEKQ